MGHHLQQNFRFVMCLNLNFGGPAHLQTFYNHQTLHSPYNSQPTAGSYGFVSAQVTLATADPARCSEPSHSPTLVIFDTAHMLPEEGRFLKPKTSTRVDLNYFRDDRATGSEEGFTRVTASRGSDG